MLHISWKTDKNDKLFATWADTDDEQYVPQSKPKVRTRNTRKMLRNSK